MKSGGPRFFQARPGKWGRLPPTTYTPHPLHPDGGGAGGAGAYGEAPRTPISRAKPSPKKKKVSVRVPPPPRPLDWAEPPPPTLRPPPTPLPPTPRYAPGTRGNSQELERELGGTRWNSKQGPKRDVKKQGPGRGGWLGVWFFPYENAGARPSEAQQGNTEAKINGRGDNPCWASPGGARSEAHF